MDEYLGWFGCNFKQTQPKIFCELNKDMDERIFWNNYKNYLIFKNNFIDGLDIH